jgi:hypothetical protein
VVAEPATEHATANEGERVLLVAQTEVAEATPVQLAQLPKSASVSDVGAVLETVEGLGVAGTEGGGKASLRPCGRTGKPLQSDEIRNKHSLDAKCSTCASSEEPDAVVQHSGIREGGTEQSVSLPQSLHK